MLSSLHLISLCSLVLLAATATSYNVFTYDDGHGDDEHCCLVQVDDEFCLAKPLTRSLIQVDKDCHRLHPNEKCTNELSKVVRRLNVQSSHQLAGQLLIELKDSLDKDILQDDLLCLSSANNNNIDLEKCHVVLPPVQAKKPKRKSKNATEAEETVEEKIEARHVKTSEPVLVQQGQGVAVRQTFQLDLTDVTPDSRQEREHWSWYRAQTKKICNQPTKHKKTCISFSRQSEKNLEQILNATAGVNLDEALLSVTTGSKLFCENNHQHTRLLGYYRDSEICFHANHRVHVEHRFTDLVSLSNAKGNRQVLQFISASTKLADEFEHDCHDKTTLADVKTALEQEAQKKEEAKKEAQQKAEAKKEAKREAEAKKEAKRKAKANKEAAEPAENEENPPA